MNVANLQLEGLLLATASLNRLLMQKGIVSGAELTRALDIAEQVALGDDRIDGLDGAQRDAIAFPIRLLRLAANGPADAPIPPFSDLAKAVGQSKERYNDAL